MEDSKRCHISGDQTFFRCTSVQAAAAIGKTFAVMAASISSCADTIGKKCVSSLVGSSCDMLRLLHFVVTAALTYA